MLHKHQKLIKNLKKGSAAAQKELYDSFSPRLMTVCMRYLKDKAWAEDTLMESFMKIFTEIKSYRELGCFEAWMYRITVNQCLMELRKNRSFKMLINPNSPEVPIAPNALSDLYEEDMLLKIESLPVGCRTVFNLYVVEGYTHKEIAYKLGITEGTSKSQLNLAKKKLKEKIHSETSDSHAKR